MDEATAALVGAALGGVLTIMGDVVARLVFEKRRRDAARDAVEQEVGTIRAEAASRETRDQSGGIPLRPPLPTTAWRALVAGGFLAKLDPADQAALLDLYRRVDEANHLSAQAVSFLLMEQNAREEDASGFHDEALRLSTTPFAGVREAADTLGSRRAR